MTARALEARDGYVSRMTERVAEILEMASSLPREEREELIDKLIDTVEPPAAASTWTPELERRAREALRGENLVGDLDDVVARVQERLRASE